MEIVMTKEEIEKVNNKIDELNNSLKTKNRMEVFKMIEVIGHEEIKKIFRIKINDTAGDADSPELQFRKSKKGYGWVLDLEEGDDALTTAEIKEALKISEKLNKKA